MESLKSIFNSCGPPESEDAGAKKNQTSAQINAKKQEVKNTKDANVKNTTEKDFIMETRTGNVVIKPNEYMKVQPIEEERQGNVYWYKDGAGLVKK